MSGNNPETLAQKRKSNQDKKAHVRRTMLSRMPKGGICVEVGVWRGDFSRMILNQIKPEKLILVDPWKNFDTRTAAFDGQTADQEFEDIYQSVCGKYAADIDQGKLEIRRGLSEPILKTMDPLSLSFIYLDGDHSYEGVKADLNAAFPLMKQGGIIMMDDYHRRGWWGDDVIRAANEFLGAHPGRLRIWAMRGAQLAIEKL